MPRRPLPDGLTTRAKSVLHSTGVAPEDLSYWTGEIDWVRVAGCYNCGATTYDNIASVLGPLVQTPAPPYVVSLREAKRRDINPRAPLSSYDR